MRQIKNVKRDGKWIELWFADGNHDPINYDLATKSYMLEDAIEKSGLYDYVYLHGRVGLWVKLSGSNGDPVSASVGAQLKQVGDNSFELMHDHTNHANDFFRAGELLMKNSLGQLHRLNAGPGDPAIALFSVA